MFIKALSCLCLALPIAAYAQNPVTVDSPYQLNYATQLDRGAAILHIANDNANNRDLCVTVVVYAPNQQPAACSSYLVGANGLVSVPLSLQAGGLLANVSNPAAQTSLTATKSAVIDLISTVAPTGAVSCLNVKTSSSILAVGALAWIERAPAVNAPIAPPSSTAFSPATLSAAQYNRLANDCTALTGQ